MNVLQEIVATKQREVEALKKKVPLAEIKEKAENGLEARSKRPFRKLFDDTQKTVLIAEIKPRSPSEGDRKSVV